MRFERLVAKAIPGASHGPWFEFSDANGHGYAQPDIIKVGRGGILLIECKFTATEEAFGQILGLYVPLLAWVYKLPVWPIIVVHNVTPTLVANCGSIAAALALAKNSILPPIVQWLGPPAPLLV